MPKVTYNLTIDAPQTEVWRFVKNMDNWAPFMMGYVDHQIVNDKESIWKLKSTIAGVTYSFQMRVLITEWREPETVGFELKGVTHPVAGNGLVKLQSAADDKTDIAFDLNLHGRGLATPIVNFVVAPLLKPMAEQLLQKINEAVGKVPA